MCSSLLQIGSGSCKAPYLPAERLEKAVLTTIQDIVLSIEHLDQLVKMLKDEIRVSIEKRDSRSRDLDRELKAVNQRLDSLFEALGTGLMAIDDLAPRIRALRQRQQQLQISRSDLIDEHAHLGQEVVTLEAVRREVGDLQ